MNDEEYMKWIKNDDGWAAARMKGIIVREILTVISEEEYFKLKLAGRLSSELHKILTDHIVENILSY